MEVLPLCWYVGLVPSPFVPPIAQLEAQLYDLLQASVGVDSPQVTAARLLELLGRHPGELSVLPTPDAPNSGELAAKKRHGSLLTAAIRHANKEVEALRAVEVLLGRGFSPTATATPAMTPLVWAVRRTFFAVADLLMEAGAAVDSWEVFDSGGPGWRRGDARWRRLQNPSFVFDNPLQAHTPALWHPADPWFAHAPLLQCCSTASLAPQLPLAPACSGT